MMILGWWCLFFVIWFLSGLGSFVFWWTKKWNVTVSDIPIAISMGLGGPIVFISGAIALWGETEAHDFPTEKVLFRCRRLKRQREKRKRNKYDNTSMY
jgi:hypothetical protein